MIQVTDQATEGLKELLDTSRVPDDQGVKLVPAETGGIGMTIGRATEGDVVFDADRKPLLIVDSGIAEHLDGATIDLMKDAGQEPQFVIQRPDAAEPS